MNALDRLQHWYAAQCDGEWEHDDRVRVETLDNPGWKLTVDLTDMDRPESFEPVSIDRSETDGTRCRLEGDVFRGWGGPLNLGELIETFLAWAEGE